MQNPFLVGEKIYLRTIEESDLNEEYQGWFNDSEVCKFNDHHRYPMYREQLADYYKMVIEPRTAIVLAIIDKETDKHFGNISLQSLDMINRSAELAIIIGDKNAWGKGVGGEACRLLIGHGFDQLNLHRIYCGTSEENIGMQTLVKKLNFKEEGLLREAQFKSGKYVNYILFSLLEHERN